MSEPSTPASHPARPSTEWLRSIVEVTRIFAEATVDFDRLLHTVVEQVGRLSSAYCSLGLISQDGRFWETVAEYGMEANTLEIITQLMGPRRFSLDEVTVTTTAL